MSEPEQQQAGVSRSRWFYHMILKAAVFHMFVSMFVTKKINNVDPVTGKPPEPFKNFIDTNELYDLYVYVSEEGHGDFENLENKGQLIFSAENQVYNHKFNRPFQVTSTEVMIPDKLYTDEFATLYAMAFLIPHKAYEEKATPFYKSTFKPGFDGHIIVESVQLTTMREIKRSKETSLVGNDDEPALSDTVEIAKHWIPRLDVNVLYDVMPHMYSPNDVYFLAFKKYPELKIYDPFVYLSQFWVLEEQYQRLDTSTAEKSMKLNIHFGTCSPTYYLLCSQFQLNSERGGFMGKQSAKEFDMIKRTIMTTNIYMLVFSAVFILLHTVFSFFALKNDIQFWHNNDSMEGLSALSVVISFVCEVIIALYIFDSENVSWLILFEIAIGLLASAWKLSKAIKITPKQEFPYFEIGNARNYVESDTKKYDEEAIKYMSIALFPCIIGYAIYSLLYQKHRSWYSYLISVAAGSVYTFGFIMMTPQIYINYKLKSVDHLPWRALIYKSLNTFVDDVASFLIDMPWMHRLSCFRDDIIFFCYLYQRWAYKVDPSRSNAWNQSSETLQDDSRGEPQQQQVEDQVSEEQQDNVTNLEQEEATQEENIEQPVRRK